MIHSHQPSFHKVQAMIPTANKTIQVANTAVFARKRMVLAQK
jgi:hypothetical protein